MTWPPHSPDLGTMRNSAKQITLQDLSEQICTAKTVKPILAIVVAEFKNHLDTCFSVSVQHIVQLLDLLFTYLQHRLLPPSSSVRTVSWTPHPEYRWFGSFGVVSQCCRWSCVARFYLHWNQSHFHSLHLCLSVVVGDARCPRPVCLVDCRLTSLPPNAEWTKTGNKSLGMTVVFLWTQLKLK